MRHRGAQYGEIAAIDRAAAAAAKKVNKTTIIKQKEEQHMCVRRLSVSSVYKIKENNYKL